MREFIRKCQFPILLALGTYPAVAVVLAFLAPGLLDRAWVLPGVYAALAVMLLLLRGKPAVVLGIGGALLMLLPCGLYLKGMERNISLLLAGAYGALLLWSMRISGWDARKEMPAGWLAGCFAIGLTGCFVAWFEVRLMPVAGWIRGSFSGFVLLAMLSLNRGSLNLASGTGRGFTATMRRKNLLLTLGMFGVALLIALIPSLFDLMSAIFAWLARLIAMLRQLLAALMPAETTVETTTEATTVPPSSVEAWMDVVLEDKNVHRNPEAINFMMTAVVLVVLIPTAVFVLYRLVRLLVKGLRRLTELIENAASVVNEDFVDEITDIREETRPARAEKKKTERPVRRLGKLTPEERIRHRYRQLLGKHPEWTDHTTARENLQEEAARLYERARYSEHPVTDRDAEQFQNHTK